MQNTTNYSLPTWEQDDQIKMSDFNALTQKLDAALKSNADAVASEVTARESAVSAEASARESAVSAEQSARAGALAAVAKNLGVEGHNARIAWGTYTGAGTYGQKNARALTCGFYPVLALVGTAAQTPVKNPAVFLRGRSYAAAQPEGGSGYAMTVTWTDNGLTWYNAGSTDPSSQLNGSNVAYFYFLLGYDKAAEEA